MATDHRATTASIEAEAHEAAPAEAGGHAGGGIHLPPTSLWPITTAFGITIAAAGFVTNFWVSIPGFAVFVWGVRGWIVELLHEAH